MNVAGRQPPAPAARRTRRRGCPRTSRGLVGDPVGLRVEAAARDPDERPRLDLARGRARAIVPVASTSQAATGSSGIPSIRAKSLPRPPGSTPSTPSVRAQRVRRPRRSARRHRTRPPSRRRRPPPAPARGRVEAARRLNVVLDTQAAEAGPHVRQRARRPAAAGRRVDDQRQLHARPRASAGRRRSRPGRGRSAASACSRW